MNDSTQFTTVNTHDVDNVQVTKTTQKGSRTVEKIEVRAGDLEVTVFGSDDEDSEKDGTISLEVTE